MSPRKSLEAKAKRTACARAWRKANSEKVKAYRKAYRQRPGAKEKQKARMRKRLEEQKTWLLEYKKTHPCEKCGESHVACINFHHRNPKNKKFYISARSRRGFGTLKKEITKCQVLCANCHRKLHWSLKDN